MGKFGRYMTLLMIVLLGSQCQQIFGQPQRHPPNRGPPPPNRGHPQPNPNQPEPNLNQPQQDPNNPVPYQPQPDPNQQRQDPNQPQQRQDPNQPQQRQDPNQPQQRQDPNQPQERQDPNQPQRRQDPNQQRHDPNQPRPGQDPNQQRQDPNQPRPHPNQLRHDPNQLRQDPNQPRPDHYGPPSRGFPPGFPPPQFPDQLDMNPGQPEIIPGDQVDTSFQTNPEMIEPFPAMQSPEFSDALPQLTDEERDLVQMGVNQLVGEIVEAVVEAVEEDEALAEEIDKAKREIEVGHGGHINDAPARVISFPYTTIFLCLISTIAVSFPI